MSENFLIGIDEAGRGPLAGPVAIGLFKINKKTLKKDFFAKNFPGLKDSKKLSEKKREEFFDKLPFLKKEGTLDFAVSLISEKIIDKKGISFAIKLGMEKCLKKVKAQSKDEILLDGGLKVSPLFKNQKTIIKGDEKEPTISLASICAKVTRDRFMKKEALKYPDFGFEVHKGYGTKKHRESIEKLGLTKIHRKSFCKKVGV